METQVLTQEEETEKDQENFDSEQKLDIKYYRERSLK